MPALVTCIQVGPSACSELAAVVSFRSGQFYTDAGRSGVHMLVLGETPTQGDGAGHPPAPQSLSGRAQYSRRGASGTKGNPERHWAARAVHIILKGRTMSLGLILVIILIIFLLGGFSGRFGGYGYGYGHGGVGIIGIIVIVLVILLLMGRI
jgi:hypothetical protein